jgi:hypothetical protein
MKCGIRVICENVSRKFKFHENLTRRTDNTSHAADRYTFSITSRPVLLRMKKFQTEVVEKIKTHFMINNCFSKIVPFYGIMWKNAIELCRPQMAMW